jgi:phosphoribosylanthranilate isomerase
VFVKICGITTEDAARAAVAAGADAVGFVFAQSPRAVTPERARELCADVPAGIKRIAVLRHPSAALVARVLDVLAPDWLQTDAEDFAAAGWPDDFTARCTPLPVYRDGRTLPPTLPMRLLFEGAVSGSGTTADWTEAAALAGRTQLILAGGLDPANVGDAIRRVRPWGVDVSSGVERSRGEKDPEKIREFVARVRAEENRT